MENHLSGMKKNGYRSGENIGFNQFQKVLDSLSAVVFALDVDGNFQYISKAALPVLGFEPEELTGRHYLELVPAKDHKKTLRYMEQLISGSAPAEFQNRLQKKGGTLIPISWAASWDAREKMFYCGIRDITERIAKQNLQERYEQEIERRNADMSEMLGRIKDGFFAMDKDWKITYLNQQVEAMVLIKGKDYVGRSYWECFPDMIGSVYFEEYHRAVTQMVPVHFEAFFPPFQKWFSVDAYPSDSGLSVFFRDVTRQRKSDELINDLSIIARETVNFVFLMDEVGAITWVNDAFTKTIGYTFDEAAGRSPKQLFRGPLTCTETTARIDLHIQAKTPVRFELQIYKKGGTPLWVESSCQPLFDENGRFKKYFIIGSDISGRKRMEEQMGMQAEQEKKRIMAAVLQAQEQERGQIGRELHDNINQVLTTVKLYSEICVDDPARLGELLPRSAKLLTGAIEEIRNLSKRLSASTVDDLHLCDALEELAGSIRATNFLSLYLDLPRPDDLNISKDLHVAIYRIVQEHLTNVLKHADASVLRLTLQKTNRNVTLMIVDDGKGFNPEVERKGVGITNMISRAESMNGSIRLISLPGNGCTMVATFPL